MDSDNTFPGDVESDTLSDRIKVPGPNIVLPAVAIAASEMFLLTGYVNLALGSHLLVLLGCTLAPLRFERATPVLSAFALVSLFRLITFGMPMMFSSPLIWILVVYASLVPGLLYFLWQTDAIEVSFELRTAGILMGPLVLPLSVGLGMTEYAVLQPEALVHSLDPYNIAVLTVVMVGVVGLGEELLFRGILQRTLQGQLGRWKGLLLASAVFGLMHSGYGIAGEVFFGAILGLVLGVLYDWTDSIVLITLLNGLVNVFLFAVIPMQRPILATLLAMVT